MSTSAIMANYNLAEAMGGKVLPEYKFYNDEVTLFYDDDIHEYTRYGEQGIVIIPGVTTVIHIIDKSAALTQWAANMTVEYIRQKMAEKYTTLDAAGTFTVMDIEGWLNDARFNFREYTKAAADIGSMAHDWLERYLRAEIKKDSEKLIELMGNLPEHEGAKNGITAALEWMAKHNVRFISTERKIYSRKYDYAGTMDGLALVDSCGDAECSCCSVVDVTTGERTALDFKDVLAVIDWKTSNRLYPEYWFQTAAYQWQHFEEFGEMPDMRFICRLGKDDAKFECQRRDCETFQQDFDTFLACLALYNNIEKGKAMEKAAKDEEKAAVKAAKLRAKDAEKEAARIAKEAVKAAKEAEKQRIAAEKAAAKEQKQREREAAKAAKKPRKKAEVETVEPIVLPEVDAAVHAWNGTEWVSKGVSE